MPLPSWARRPFSVPSAPRRPRLQFEPLEDRSVPATAIGLNFAGGNLSNSGAFPPDTDGAIGPNNYVEMLNGVYRVFNKSTGAVVQNETDGDFWRAAGVSTSIVGTSGNDQVSDPRVIYDPLSGRWFASEISVISTFPTGNPVLIARSDTNNPAGTWHAATFVQNSSRFADYPTLGVDFNAVYIGINDFSGNTPNEAINSIPKADLLLSTPSVANRTPKEQNAGSVTIGETPQGVTNFNSGQTSSSHGSVFAADFNSFGKVDRTKVTGAGAAGATFGTSTVLTVQSTSAPGLAHQPDGTAVVDALDGRVQGMVYQVGDLIVGTLVTTVGGRDAIRITVMSDSGNSILTEATISNSTYDYIDPSLVMNAEGDMVIGFTRSGGSGSSNGNLGAYYRYAYINPANPAGGITVDTSDTAIQAGLVGNYHGIVAAFGGNNNTTVERWGDYSATNLDPNNATAFWTTQEYAISSSAWGTRIAQVYVSPRVKVGVGVSSTAADGTYTFGDTIPITVTFNDAVNVTGTPTLALNSGGTAAYVSGSGTTTLTFNYIVGTGQSSADLDYASAGALSLNGGTIKDVNNGANALDAILTLPAPGSAGSLGANKNIVIVPGPTVSNVTSTAVNGPYGFGATIPITLTFNQAVDVTGTPTVALNSGGTAAYASGSGTTTLTFSYTVGLNDFAADLDEASASAVSLNGGTIDQHGTTNPAVLTLPAPQAAGSLGANKSIAVDGRPAKVSGLSTTVADGTYGYGAVIPVTVTFDKPVDVTGSPQLAVNSGSTLTYSGGDVSGVTSLTFTLTVGLTDTTNGQRLDETSTGALTLNGGSIQDHADPAAAAGLTLPAPGAAGSLSATHNIVVDGTPAKVMNVTSSLANGTYGIGTAIPIIVTFTKPVNVTGSPQLALNSGGSAAYTSGSGTTTLTFTYTVAAGQDAANLDYTSATALSLNAGTINDVASGTPAPLTLPAPGAAGSLGANKSLLVDTVPRVTGGVTSTLADGSYGNGQVVPITVTFGGPVVVSGTPVLALNAGASAAAGYTGGSGTAVLTFTYTVGLGDFASPLDYASAGALTLNGGTIRDAANTNVSAILTLPAPGAAGSLSANKTINVDGRPAQPSNLTTTLPNGTYGIGTVIPITVTFTKPVDVTGSPQLALDSGGTAVYAGGNATDVTALTFTYTVQAGDGTVHLDELSASALTLNGGTIQDHASNSPATLTLPAPSAAGSLGANSSVVIDTGGPIVQQFRVKFGTKWYNLIGSQRADVPWKVTAIQVVFSQPVKTGDVHSLTGLTAGGLSGLGTNTLTWRLATPIVQGSFNTSLATTGADALKNATGAPVSPFTQAFRVLYGDVNGDLTVDAADEAGVRAALPAPYRPLTSGYNLFADLDGNGFVNLTDVGIARSRRGATLL